MSGVTFTFVAYAAIAILLLLTWLVYQLNHRKKRKTITQEENTLESGSSSKVMIEVTAEDGDYTGSNTIMTFEKTKLYDGIPPGAVFESLRNALRNLDFKTIQEEPTNFVIIAEEEQSAGSLSTRVTLGLKQINFATELIFSTPMLSNMDADPLKSTFTRLTEQIDREIEVLHQAGRIVRPAPIVYSFSEVFSNNESSEGATQKSGNKTNSDPISTNAPSDNDKRQDSGSKTSRWGPIDYIVMGGITAWLFLTPSGAEFRSMIGDFLSGEEVDIAQYNCEKLAEDALRLELQNAFGAKYKVISSTELQEISRTDLKLVCSGMALLSDGNSERIEFSAEKVKSDGRVLVRVSTVPGAFD